jgi:hypothetical protein
MNYCLKDKIQITDEYVESLIEKGWQEIETLQGHLSNISSDSAGSEKIKQFLNNLLTSYYIFVGNLEGFTARERIVSSAEEGQEIPDVGEEGKALETEEVYIEPSTFIVQSHTEPTEDTFEPFEYFVDFEEPVGEPLSDEDLYGKK